MRNRPVVNKVVKRFFVDIDREQIYQERVTLYRELLEELYPSLYNWEVHCNLTREMVRREMELEVYDRLILNDMDNAWMMKLRKEASDTLRMLRRDLGITLPVMKKLKDVGEDTSFEADMGRLIERFQVANQ